MNRPYKTLTLPIKEQYRVAGLPNFHRSGSISGMKKLYYGKNAMLVRCGSWIYDCTSRSSVYLNNAH